MARSTSDGFFRGLRAAGTAVAIVWGSSVGHAASLDVTGIEKGSDLYDAVLGGSLLREQTAEDASPSTQELLAAAQADYARVLAVLYDQG